MVRLRYGAADAVVGSGRTVGNAVARFRPRFAGAFPLRELGSI